MAGTCLIHCVLIQVLLITVYAQFPTNCANQATTEGKPVHLTCNVTCKKCELDSYTWKHGETKINCSKMRNFTSGNSHIFHCINESASASHSGTFTFWVQMKEGIGETKFSVTIERPAANLTTPGPVSTTNSHGHEEKLKTSPKGRSPEVALAVLFMICLALGLIVAVLFIRNKNCNMSISSIFTHKMITETEII